jgi:hypothetical protein
VKRVIRFAALIVCGFSIVACRGDAGSPTINWRTPSSTVGKIERSLCDDCFSIEKTVTISIDSGDGLIDETPYVALDSANRFWFGYIGYVNVHAFDGKFLSRLGRKGSGPGEFQTNGTMEVDRSGTVHIFDYSLSKQVVVTPSLEIVSETRMPPGMIRSTRALTNGGFVANAELTAEPQNAYPLHWIDSSGTFSSFGADSGVSRIANSPELEGAVAVVEDSLVVFARRYVNKIEVYNRAGRRLRAFTLPLKFSLPPNGVPVALTRETELYGSIQDISYDAGLLYVLTWQPSKDWRSLIEAKPLPNGGTYLKEKDDSRSVYEARVHVVDLAAQKVVAEAGAEVPLWSFLGAKRLYGYTYGDKGEPRFTLFTLNWRETPR